MCHRYMFPHDLKVRRHDYREISERVRAAGHDYTLVANIILNQFPRINLLRNQY